MVLGLVSVSGVDIVAHVVIGYIQRVWAGHRGPCGDGVGTACLGRTLGAHVVMGYVQRIWAGIGEPMS